MSEIKSMSEEARETTRYGELGEVKLVFAIIELIIVAFCLPFFVREREQPMVKFRSWGLMLWLTFMYSISTLTDAILSKDGWVTYNTAPTWILCDVLADIFAYSCYPIIFLSHYFLLQLPVAQTALLDPKIMLDPVKYADARKRLERVKWLSSDFAAWVLYVPNVAAMTGLAIYANSITDTNEYISGQSTPLLETWSGIILAQSIIATIWLIYYSLRTPRDNFYIRQQYWIVMVIVDLVVIYATIISTIDQADLKRIGDIIFDFLNLLLIGFFLIPPLWFALIRMRYKTQNFISKLHRPSMVSTHRPSHNQHSQSNRLIHSDNGGDDGENSNSRASVSSGNEGSTVRRSVHITISAILNDPVLAPVFRKYLAREFSMESLLFIEAVKKYKAQFNNNQDVPLSGQDVKAAITLIMKEFILPSAVNEVNLPKKSVDKVKRAIEALESGDSANPAAISPARIFDEAADHIEAMLAVNHLRKFQGTSEFKDAVGAT